MSEEATKTPMEVFTAAFEEMMAMSFPGVSKDSRQYSDSFGLFLAGATTTIELTSRPHESVEQAEAYVAGILEFVADRVQQAQARRQ